MTKNEFRILFFRVLEEATRETEARLDSKISRIYEIHLYGAGYSDYSLTAEEALNILYIDTEHFYRVIDICIVGIRNDLTQVFVRISDHEPSTFERTWNTPPGHGPFKQLIAKEIRYLD